MTVYLDLTLLNFVLLTMVARRFMHIFTGYRLKRRDYIGLALISTSSLGLLYLPKFLSLIILLGTLFTLYLVTYRRRGFELFVIHFLTYFIIGLFEMIFIPGVSFRSFIPTITAVQGCFGYLGIIFIELAFELSTLMVDHLYHLKNYKTEGKITVGNELIFGNGYFDTGNTLLYNEVPIVFVANSKWPKSPLSPDIYVKMSGKEGLIKNVDLELYSALISFGTKKKDYFVYICKRDELFNGCDFLLNAYLG